MPKWSVSIINANHACQNRDLILKNDLNRKIKIVNITLSYEKTKSREPRFKRLMPIQICNVP